MRFIGFINALSTMFRPLLEDGHLKSQMRDHLLGQSFKDLSICWLASSDEIQLCRLSGFYVSVQMVLVFKYWIIRKWYTGSDPNDLGRIDFLQEKPFHSL